jgi:hypothetical protein
MIDRAIQGVLGVALAVSLFWGTTQGFKLRDVKAQFQQYKAEQAVKQAEAIGQALKESQARIDRQQEVVRNAEKSLVQARNEAVAAGDVARRMRDQLATYRPPAAGDACAPERSKAARLAEVLGACTDEYRAVAEAADRAVIAGLACEASYESLKPAP